MLKSRGLKGTKVCKHLSLVIENNTKCDGIFKIKGEIVDHNYIVCISAGIRFKKLALNINIMNAQNCLLYKQNKIIKL